MNMTPEWKKTTAFALAALVLTTTAVLSRTASFTKWSNPETFAEQGKEFFPKFKDPLECTSLEVIEVDAETATANPFRVMLKDGKWILPSFNEYPADAKDRLAKTASGVIDLTRDKLASIQQSDHEKLGVVDPLEAKGTGKGAGKRVTLRDKGDQVLADFIIGNEVSGNPKQRYVRVPSEKWTYAVNVNVDLSTKFADWIETNLLKIDTTKIRKIVLDSTKAIPRSGRIQIVNGDVVTISRKDAAAPWTMEDLPEGQEISTEQVNELIRALGDLKIAGVRRKPEGLTKDLKSREGKITLDQETIYGLAQRGFYLVQGGELLSNQGEVRVECEDGAFYVLHFGEVTFAKGEQLAGGKDEIKKAEPGKEEAKPEKKGDGVVESRFLLVTTNFDPDFIPAEKPKFEATESLPDDVFLRDLGDAKRQPLKKTPKRSVRLSRTIGKRRSTTRESASTNASIDLHPGITWFQAMRIETSFSIEPNWRTRRAKSPPALAERPVCPPAWMSCPKTC